MQFLHVQKLHAGIIETACRKMLYLRRWTRHTKIAHFLHMQFLCAETAFSFCTKKLHSGDEALGVCFG